MCIAKHKTISNYSLVICIVIYYNIKKLYRLMYIVYYRNISNYSLMMC